MPGFFGGQGRLGFSSFDTAPPREFDTTGEFSEDVIEDKHKLHDHLIDPNRTLSETFEFFDKKY